MFCSEPVGKFAHWTTFSADVGPVVEGPSWLSTEGMVLTGCLRLVCVQGEDRAEGVGAHLGSGKEGTGFKGVLCAYVI